MKRDKTPWKLSLACLVGSLGLYFILTSPFLSAGRQQAISVLDRDSYGGGERQVPVVIDGISGDSVACVMELQPREYTKTEAATVFDSVMERIGAVILQENVSLLEIRGDLNLITDLETEGVRLNWQTDLPEYLNHVGQVTNAEVPEQGAAGYLKVGLSAGGHKADYEIPIRILPPDYNEEERFLVGLTGLLRRLDREQATQPQLQLPGDYEGKPLKFYLDEAADYRGIPAIGAAVAVMLLFRTQEEEKKKQRAREQQMLLDYSDLFTKLMVFIGAGMTVRLAWERIVKDYQAGVASGSQKPRHVYEEMCHTCNQMQSGMPEGKAYQEFGERCRLQPYLKLSSLLEQNRKTGMKNMWELMRKEVDDAFVQRKHLVKRLGEEAGTKLTAPLFLILGVIMVIVLFPAMMNMR